jgi:hypothetical protein
MVTVILIHDVLVFAFGVGVIRASGRRSLSWVGGLLIAIGVTGVRAGAQSQTRARTPGLGSLFALSLMRFGGRRCPPD